MFNNVFQLSEEKKKKIISEAAKFMLNATEEESDSIEKGKEFINKLFELKDDNSRNRVGIVLTAYLIKNYENRRNK